MNRIMVAFDPPALDYVFRLLMSRPWGEVNALVTDIQAQVASQQGQALTGQRMEAGRQEGNRQRASNGGETPPEIARRIPIPPAMIPAKEYADGPTDAGPG